MQPHWEAPTPNPVMNPLLFRANSQIPEYPDNPIFVLIRAAEKRNIDIAQSSRKWVFSPQTEKKVIHYAMVIKFREKNKLILKTPYSRKGKRSIWCTSSMNCKYSWE